MTAMGWPAAVTTPRSAIHMTAGFRFIVMPSLACSTAFVKVMLSPLFAVTIPTLPPGTVSDPVPVQAETSKLLLLPRLPTRLATVMPWRSSTMAVEPSNDPANCALFNVYPEPRVSTTLSLAPVPLRVLAPSPPAIPPVRATSGTLPAFSVLSPALLLPMTAVMPVTVPPSTPEAVPLLPFPRLTVAPTLQSE